MLAKLLGTEIALEGKIVAVTGASGTLGRSLLRALQRQGAKPLALTTSAPGELEPGVPTRQWQPGAERQLRDTLEAVDILIINHGWNSHSDRSPEAVQRSLEANALSGWRLMELFFEVAAQDPQRSPREVWINTSEAEVSPAFSPLYEISKRLMGDLVTLRRLDAPCPVRKIILGPFKSNLNPIGIMSADWVAWAVVALAKRDVRTIIVTINPLTYGAIPLKEILQGLYFRLFSQGR